MHKLTTIAAVMLGLSFGAAHAQTTTPNDQKTPAGQETSRADCLKAFRAADKDGDGTLSVSEAEDAKSVIPTNLALPGPITQSEFMTACTANVPKGG